MKQLEMNLLFFLGAHFTGAGETGSSGDGEHSRAPADVKPFSDFIPATQQSSVSHSCSAFNHPRSIRPPPRSYLIPG